jgi:hypothetical protein
LCDCLSACACLLACLRAGLLRVCVRGRLVSVCSMVVFWNTGSDTTYLQPHVKACKPL